MPSRRGNKRTCYVAMVQFFKINGYDLAIDDSRPWAEEIIALVEHRSSEEDFVRTVRSFVVATCDARKPLASNAAGG